MATRERVADKQSRKRFDEVVGAAAKVFCEKGYQATSVQDVADAVGLLKGSLYYYIDTKEDLLVAVIDTYHQQARERLDALEALDLPVLERLRRFIEEDTAHTGSHLLESRLFYTEWRNVERSRRQRILAERDRHQRFLEDCIREGQEQGVVRAGLDPKLAANGILGMVNSVYQWYKPRGRSTIEEVAQTYADLIVGGLEA